MLLRRSSLVALGALALAACEPSLPTRTNPATTNYAVFDPATSQLPLPNDLALLPSSVAAASGAQQTILKSFQAAGGFPNDQEVPILIDVQRITSSGSTVTTAAPPEAEGVDVASISDDNLLVLRGAPGATPARVPLKDANDKPNFTFNYVTNVYAPDRGTLEIHNAVRDATGSLAWPAGQQTIVALRGGPNGVKLKGGGTLTQMQTMYLLTRGVKLDDPKNQTTATRGTTGVQLEQLRQGFLPVFNLAEAAWGTGGSKEMVSVQAFTIAPKKTGTFVVTDPSARNIAPPVPLPSDLLLDPGTGKVVNNPALCLPAPDPTTGTCALAQGLATLDGFSTTALLASAASAPVAVATINKDTVFLYDLSNPAQPVRVKEVTEGAGAGFEAEPLLLGRTSGGAACSAATPADCFSTALGLQPAIPSTRSGALVTLPPLKENTEYAVLVTDGVKDTQGQGLKRSSTSSVLLLDQPLVVDGKPAIGGQPSATVAGLEKIRQGVDAAAKALAAEKGIAKDRVVLGYTVKTQSISDAAVKLAGAPYQNAAAFVPGTPVDLTPTFQGIAGGRGIPFDKVQKVFAVPVPTLNPIDPATGAINPDNTKWAQAQLNALVFVPATTGTQASPAAAPLVVFQHGLGQDKSNLLAIGNALATAGFVAAAVDAPLHGDRSLCAAPSDCTCTGAFGACTTPTCDLKGTFGGALVVGGAAQQLGFCGGGSTIVTGRAPPAIGSGTFFVSPNLFMTRDALRQDLLDTSALILALAPPAAASNAFTTDLRNAGVAIDGTKVYWVGQSLGGILGTLNAAADPRISKAVLNVPGGTLADVFTQSPTFQPQVNALLGQLGITPGSPQFLLFVNVAKWVIDPGDPLNFAAHLTGDAAHPTLPNFLAGNAPQSAKSVLGQIATCDNVIPNPFNLELLGNVFGSLPAANATSANVVTYVNTANAGGACPLVPTASPGTVNHGFLLDFAAPAVTAQGQADAAAFLANGTLPPATRAF